MSKLSLQQIMISRFRTSAEADSITVALMSKLGLSTKANVARLAIGRSLALGAFTDNGIDSKGLEIPASVLFTQEDVKVWVGLVVTHSMTHGGDVVNSMDTFRVAVRKHWHRGAQLLLEDWDGSSGNFEKFLETLVIRRADLPDVAAGRVSKKDSLVKVEEPQNASAILLKSLAEIGVIAEIKGLIHGPRVTRYKVFLPDINQLDKLRKGLERLGLALNLQQAQPTLSPGNEAKTVSLDVPRPQSTWTPVGFAQFRSWLAATPSNGDQLIVYPGVDVLGKPYSFDLATAPHLLVGGTTGSGKSNCLHALILSLLSRIPSTVLKLALIDPKQVEFSVYQGSDYLYREVSTDASSARELLLELVAEMEARYHKFMTAGVSNILEARRKQVDLPYIVVFIEEFADLIFVDKGIEDQIVRLAQKARAAGIHLVLATQRPDAKTFSGLIRSNIPARIALTVQKSTESKIILDESGAETLLGLGDMLVKAKPGSQPERSHGVRIERADIEAVLKENRQSDVLHTISGRRRTG
ncbi:S-DNA-T family DNA segregation ATPase FtsK/SpoIIIE [Nitrosospira sp. Nsp5]|uniref:DNA segregation ATPase FtsK/SpoIIIE, S-DNA-T family n=1 Tax=Nitrosospira multiformis TaxID=1231 RepID=A0ABY0TL88_9PROT|nr:MULTISPECIES: FtsK/SpoIIIE domain-containing protein [Nitrosospira]PTR09947.1 S-DNA-T family DNA segregation ATPase FtsK/SpoIIIE [Nitrosospira sp. Nsp5]SDR00715.1 DNA segregation ATPase FtsK/SpoIIIE, S-DNA-T family [Nitrosospira multiformis]